MSDALHNGLLFLVTTLFDLYIFVLLIRLVLIYVRADYYNPISQIITKLTQPVITPLRKFIPNYKNLELATLALILILEVIKFLCIGLLLVGVPNPIGLLLLACADALKSTINIFFYAIILQAILSWVHAGYSPGTELLAKLTAPILQPIQRLVPPIGGTIDISPVFAMILLKLTLIILIGPLFAMGQAMAFH